MTNRFRAAFNELKGRPTIKGMTPTELAQRDSQKSQSNNWLDALEAGSSILHLRGLIEKALGDLDDSEVEAIHSEYLKMQGDNQSYWILGNAWVFHTIIWPLIWINSHSLVYQKNIEAITRTFIIKLNARITEIRTWPKGSIEPINKTTIERLRWMKWFWVVSEHIAEWSKLLSLGYPNAGYSQLMNWIEKLLKRIAIVYKWPLYKELFREEPINGTMESFLKLLRKLQWNDRQYIKPIEDLNKFVNDEKHAFTHRGNTDTLSAHSYDGLLSFIIDWIAMQEATKNQNPS